MKDIELTLSVSEINLVLESLGHMPYMRVITLINKIHTQATHQVGQLNGNNNHDADQKSDVKIFNS